MVRILRRSLGPDADAAPKTWQETNSKSNIQVLLTFEPMPRHLDSLQAPPCPLLALPPELRLRIWEHCLLTLPFTYIPIPETFSPPQTTDANGLALLRVSKQLYGEILPIYLQRLHRRAAEVQDELRAAVYSFVVVAALGGGHSHATSAFRVKVDLEDERRRLQAVVERVGRRVAEIKQRAGEDEGVDGARGTGQIR